MAKALQPDRLTEEWKPGGGSFGGGGASGSWNLALQLSADTQEATKKQGYDVDALRQGLSSVRVVSMETPDDSALLAFIVDAETVGGRDNLPRHLTVGIGGEPTDLIDLWHRGEMGGGSGCYVVPIRAPQQPPPTAAQALGTFERVTGGPPRVVPPDLGGSVSIETVPCPPGCKSIIFGSPCVLCVKIKVELTW